METCCDKRLGVFVIVVAAGVFFVLIELLYNQPVLTKIQVAFNAFATSGSTNNVKPYKLFSDVSFDITDEDLFRNEGWTKYTYGPGNDVFSAGGNGNLVRKTNNLIRQESCVRRLPQAIIAGIQKCGTTALLKFLNAHPKIAACLDPIEPMFFSDHYDSNLTVYKNMMPCSYSDQITMEKSPPYFYRDYCAERIRKMNESTKIIFIIKDPVIRSISMFSMYEDQGRIKEDLFEDIVTLHNRTMVNARSKLIDFSNYAKYMLAWLQNFNLNQILLVDGHKIEEDPAKELAKVERFLGLQTYFTPDMFIFNATKRKYCLLLDGDSTLSCLSDQKGRKHPEIDEAVIKLLQNYFRPLNRKFFQMVKRSFDWGY